MARQIRKSGVKEELVGEAGRVINLEGAITGEIGKILEGALKEGMAGKEARDAELTAEGDKIRAEKEKIRRESQDRLNTGIKGPNLETGAEITLGGPGGLAELGDRLKTQTLLDIGNVPDNEKRVYTDKMAWDNMTEAEKASHGNVFANFSQKAEAGRKAAAELGFVSQNFATADNQRDQATSTQWSMEKGFQKQAANRAMASANPMAKRLKNPIKRVKGGDTSYMQNAGKTPSQFTEGRTFVEKKQYLDTTNYTVLDSAGVKAFNIGIQQDNYEAQVQADWADFTKQRKTKLIEEATEESLLDSSILESFRQIKSEISESTKLSPEERELADARSVAALES